MYGQKGKTMKTKIKLLIVALAMLAAYVQPFLRLSVSEVGVAVLTRTSVHHKYVGHFVWLNK